MLGLTPIRPANFAVFDVRRVEDEGAVLQAALLRLGDSRRGLNLRLASELVLSLEVGSMRA